MFKRLNTDTFNLILIIGVILLVIEVVFFFGGTIFPAIFSGILAYIGWKNFHKLWGKILFWIFIISTVLSILNLIAVRFFVVAALVLYIIDYSKSRKEATYHAPELIETIHQESIIKKKPLFNHKVFGDQKTDDTAYGWRDINIHAFFGNRIIDLGNTVLPNDTAVISIRHVVGNIEIYVPYEVEVSIHHSSVFGRATIFGNYHEKLMNKSLIYQTENYDTSYPRVKIITSVLSGDIEVRRI